MVDNVNDIGFIQDLSHLDSLRKKAVSGDSKNEEAALKAAAKQFESIFTSMLMKSMRQSNSAFKSDLNDSRTQDFYQNMWDQQMSSQLSANGSLGLADMIYAQLSKSIPQTHAAPKAPAQDALQIALERVRAHQAQEAERSHSPADAASVKVATAAKAATSTADITAEPKKFNSPHDFIDTLKPYAIKAAKALGIEPTLLLAQAALETGWGEKMVKNSAGSSYNLFNIKADSRWKGDKIHTQTLEYEDHTPVLQKAAFRAYNNYQDSFNDYVNFLESNPRYTTALTQSENSANFIRNIHKAGYATDPNYPEKVLKLQEKIEKMD